MVHESFRGIDTVGFSENASQWQSIALPELAGVSYCALETPANGTLFLSPFLASNPNLHQDSIDPKLDPHHVGQARVTESNAYSNYHALQAVVQKRLSGGLQLQANYTWSKCLGNSSGFFAQLLMRT